jgi:putative lipoprotein (rSAM/lipoprotein system)
MNILKIASLFVSALFGIFCNSNGRIVPLYGAPLAEYKISGTIKSADQHLPVNQLSVYLKDSEDVFRIIDSTKTNEFGKYIIQYSAGPGMKSFVVSIKDTDLSDNGSFKDKDTIISITENEIANSWIVEKTVDFKIEKKD